MAVAIYNNAPHIHDVVNDLTNFEPPTSSDAYCLIHHHFQLKENEVLHFFYNEEKRLCVEASANKPEFTYPCFWVYDKDGNALPLGFTSFEFNYSPPVDSCGCWIMRPDLLQPMMVEYTDESSRHQEFFPKPLDKNSTKPTMTIKYGNADGWCIGVCYSVGNGHIFAHVHNG